MQPRDLTYQDWCQWRDEHFGDDGVIALEYLADMPEAFQACLEHDVGKGIIRYSED